MIDEKKFDRFIKRMEKISKEREKNFPKLKSQTQALIYNEENCIIKKFDMLIEEYKRGNKTIDTEMYRYKNDYLVTHKKMNKLFTFVWFYLIKTSNDKSLYKKDRYMNIFYNGYQFEFHLDYLPTMPTYLNISKVDNKSEDMIELKTIIDTVPIYFPPKEEWTKENVYSIYC